MGTGELLRHYIVATRPGGVEILLAASCYKNRDKLRQLRARLAPRLHFYFISQTKCFPNASQ